MSTRTVSKTIDLTSIPSDIAISKYITVIGNDGIKVHPYNTTVGQADIDNYVKIDSDSMEIWQKPTGASASIKVAEFGVNGVQIGQIGESHLEIDYHSLQMIDKEGDTYFHVSDLRTKQEVGGQVVYLADVIESFVGNGSNTRFGVTFSAIQSITSVTINGTATNAYTYDDYSITFTTAPASGSAISVEYVTDSNKVKAYTFGIRNSSAFVGALSVVEGYNSDARGMYSHAEGSSTSSQGTASHTEGRGTIARKDSSHAEGNWTETRSRASHAEGINTITAGEGAHAEGWGTRGYGDASHAEGKDTVSAANYSHAQNLGTLAQYQSQTVIGEYNDPIYGDAFEIGNGNGIDDDPKERSNALTVDWDGNLKASGNITDGNNNILKSSDETISALSSASANCTDDTVIITSNANGETDGHWYRRPMTALWNYILSKIRSVVTYSDVGACGPLTYTQTAYTAVTIGANTYKSGTITAPTVSGYTPVCICGWNWNNQTSSQTGETMPFLNRLFLSSGTVSYTARNVSSSSITTSLRVWILYRKS